MRRIEVEVELRESVSSNHAPTQRGGRKAVWGRAEGMPTCGWFRFVPRDLIGCAEDR